MRAPGVNQPGLASLHMPSAPQLPPLPNCWWGEGEKDAGRDGARDGRRRGREH